MVCKKCGAQISANARFCDGCGATVKQDMSSVRNTGNTSNAGNTRNNQKKVKTKTGRNVVGSVVSVILIILVMSVFRSVLRVGVDKTLDKLGSLIGLDKDKDKQDADAEDTEGSINIVSALDYVSMLQGFSFNQYPDTTVYDMLDVVFTDVEYTAHMSGNNVPLIVIEGNRDGSHYVVTTMLIGSEEFKNTYGNQFASSYSDEFYVANAIVDQEPVMANDFLNSFFDFYEESITGN